MRHDDGKPEKRRAQTGAPCFLCHRGGAHEVTVRVQLKDKVLADERMTLCDECASNRFRVAEAVRRIG